MNFVFNCFKAFGALLSYARLEFASNNNNNKIVICYSQVANYFFLFTSR